MILDRIKQYLDVKGISISAFEKSIGMSNASFGKSLKKGGAIGTDKLENILCVYTDISPSWLLTGKGDMLINDTASSAPSQPAASSAPADVMKMLADLIEQNKVLLADNQKLRREAEDMDKGNDKGDDNVTL